MSRGFTLIEMIVALLLTSLVALLAHGMLAAVLGGAEAMRRSVPPASGPTLGLLWMTEACRTLEVGTAPGLEFEGSATEARFTSRLPTVDGWPERRNVAVEVDSGAVMLRMPDLTAEVVDGVEGPVMDYLVDAAGEGGWVSGWSSPVSAPVAIRFRWMRQGVPDTLLCPIGGRG